MPGIAQGIPGAKAFDEMFEQTQVVQFRNDNNGKPPDSQVVIEPETTNEFRKSVMQALGVGKGLTRTA